MERETPAPGGRTGFAAAVVVNVCVAVAFWVAGTSKYGLSGGDSFAYHLEEEWVRPTGLFLAIALLAGLFHVFFRGWRWVAFGAGVIAGALTVGLLDLGWTFLYLVSQGS